MKNRIIYLNGFMACGKSTIGPILANTLGWDFFDLDKIIEYESGKKITEIFQEEGEKFFREKESEILLRLSKLQNCIISLGGGTSANQNNLEILKSSGYIFYLKASPELLYKRLKSKNDRPVLNDAKQNLQEKISELLKIRTPFYEQADYIIDTDFKSLGILVDKIANIISKKIDEKN